MDTTQRKGPGRAAATAASGHASASLFSVSAEPTPSPEEALDVVLSDTHPVVRAGLAELLHQVPVVRVVSVVAPAHLATPAPSADVWIIGISRHWPAAVAMPRRVLPGAARLGILHNNDADVVERARSLQLDGYMALAELTTADRLGEGLAQTLDSNLRLPPAMTNPPNAVERPGDRDARLTRRQQEVLELVASGMSNKQIAEALYISVDGVKRHVSAILARTQLARRSQLIALALRKSEDRY